MEWITPSNQSHQDIRMQRWLKLKGPNPLKALLYTRKLTGTACVRCLVCWQITDRVNSELRKRWLKKGDSGLTVPTRVSSGAAMYEGVVKKKKKDRSLRGMLCHALCLMFDQNVAKKKKRKQRKKECESPQFSRHNKAARVRKSSREREEEGTRGILL